MHATGIHVFLTFVVCGSHQMSRRMEFLFLVLATKQCTSGLVVPGVALGASLCSLRLDSVGSVFLYRLAVHGVPLC